MPRPQVQNWHDAGDVLAQGGTVQVSETPKIEQFDQPSQPMSRPEKGS